MVRPDQVAPTLCGPRRSTAEDEMGFEGCEGDQKECGELLPLLVSMSSQDLEYELHAQGGSTFNVFGYNHCRAHHSHVITTLHRRLFAWN